MEELDIKFMELALKEAQKCLDIDEVPVGAVIVEDGKVLARAHNEKEKRKDATAHAEMLVIKKVERKKRTWHLENCTIYVTLEPCSMCAGALIGVRVKRIVYGTKDEKGGAFGSSYDLREQKGINHHPDVEGGVLKEKCSEILKNYFKDKRKKNK